MKHEACKLTHKELTELLQRAVSAILDGKTPVEVAETIRVGRSTVFGWMKREYPAIRRSAKRKKAQIFFGDEAGVRSDAHAGTTWAPVGRTPVVITTGARFGLNIGDGTLTWERKHESIEKEAGLDGVYVIRTSEPASRMSAEDAVRTYRNLAEAERVFRGM